MVKVSNYHSFPFGRCEFFKETVQLNEYIHFESDVYSTGINEDFWVSLEFFRADCRLLIVIFSSRNLR